MNEKKLLRIAIGSAFILGLALGYSAWAEDEGPKPSLGGGPIRYAEVKAEDLHPSFEFTADQGLGLVQAARNATGAKEREAAQTNTEYCFKLMKDAVDDGQCSVTFFAEAATCDQEAEATGCFENRFFRRKLSRLGFDVHKIGMPTADQDDDCRAITVRWCRDLRKK